VSEISGSRLSRLFLSQLRQNENDSEKPTHRGLLFRREKGRPGLAKIGKPGRDKLTCRRIPALEGGDWTFR
jgi:hypothetical protein